MNKHETPVEVKNCTFTGQFSNHIDRKSLFDDKKINKDPKIKFESCKFSSEIESDVNSKKNLQLFDSIDGDSQVFNFNKIVESEIIINDAVSPSKDANNKKYGVFVIFVIASFVLSILVIMSVIISKRNNSSQGTEDIFEIADDL